MPTFAPSRRLNRVVTPNLWRRGPKSTLPAPRAPEAESRVVVESVVRAIIQTGQGFDPPAMRSSSVMGGRALLSRMRAQRMFVCD